MTIFSKCPYCTKSFSLKGIHTHLKRAHGTDEEKSKYQVKNNRNGYFYGYRDPHDEERLLQYNLNPNLCKYCNSEIPYSKKNNKFCSRTCSGFYNNQGRVLTEEHKKN